VKVPAPVARRRQVDRAAARQTVKLSGGATRPRPPWSRSYVRWGAPPGPGGRGPARRSLRDGMPSPTSSCGQLVRVQRQLFSAYPQYLVVTGDHAYDEVDALAADVCSTINGAVTGSTPMSKSRRGSMRITCNTRRGKLYAAMLQLERIARLNRPRQDHWRSDLPLPGVYVEPRICPE
jgi:hypothetical protein